MADMARYEVLCDNTLLFVKLNGCVRTVRLNDNFSLFLENKAGIQKVAKLQVHSTVKSQPSSKSDTDRDRRTD